MSEFNAVADLASWSRRVTGMYLRDLNALTEEQFAASPGGCARSARDLCAEIALTTRHFAAFVRGDEFPLAEGATQALAATFTSREIAGKAVREAGEELASSIEKSRDRMGEPVTAPWGETMSAFALANIAANHIMYHDGHLTHCQMLAGDGEMHWFDPEPWA